jgi:hypothetical protein
MWRFSMSLSLDTGCCDGNQVRRCVFFTFPRMLGKCRAIGRGSSGSRSASAARLPGPIAGTANARAVRQAYYRQRIRFQRIADRKLRRRQSTEDGNVEISGRDLRESRLSAPVSSGPWR